MENWHDPVYRKIIRTLPRGTRAAEFITSLSVAASKPRPKGRR
jgi:hypothetical protein